MIEPAAKIEKRKRKQAQRSRVLDYAVFLLLRVFAAVVHMLPLGLVYQGARFFGDLMYRFDARHRWMAEEHLRRSFPQWEAPQIRRTARLSMQHMACLAVEVLFTTRLVTLQRWADTIELADIREGLEMMIRHDRPLIFVTGHYGNWEILGFAISTLGFPLTAIARSLNNPYLNRYILEVRERNGLTILDKFGATRELGGILSANGSVAFIADQDAGRKGMFVDFFGRPASTYKAIGLMAMKHRAPVIIGYNTRIGDNFRFRLGLQRIIHPEEWEAQEDPLRWITQEYTRELENCIRRAPEQYLWAHRRWKHRPKGQVAGKHGVA